MFRKLEKRIKLNGQIRRLISLIFSHSYVIYLIDRVLLREGHLRGTGEDTIFLYEKLGLPFLQKKIQSTQQQFRYLLMLYFDNNTTLLPYIIFYRYSVVTELKNANLTHNWEMIF